MAIYVTSKCPRCKYKFESFEPSWIAFGDPRIKCPQCGQIVLFKNIKEWKLRSLAERIWIIFQHYTFHNLVYTIPILLILFLATTIILPLIWKSYDEIVTSDIEVLLWTIIGSIIFINVGFYRHKTFIKEIEESNQRMRNKEYSDVIKNLYK
jgi:hypothetical protein